MSELRNDLRQTPPAAQGREVLRVEVGVPSPMLKNGLTFIDTPPASVATGNRTCRRPWGCYPRRMRC